MPGNRDAILAALFEAHFEPLLAYARRRTPQRFDAEDLVAETFAVAWRRLDRLPRAPEQQLPWLYGVARRLLATSVAGRCAAYAFWTDCDHLHCATGGSPAGRAITTVTAASSCHTLGVPDPGGAASG